MMYATPKDTHGLRLAHEAKGRVLSIEMALKAAIFRTESRGVHFREDFPETKGNQAEHITITHPVERIKDTAVLAK